MANSISSISLPRCFIFNNGSHKSRPWPSSSSFFLNKSSKHHPHPLLSLSSSPSSVVETDNDDDNDLTFSGCRACGKEEKESGCNGDGRIQGGIATVPGFGWWPIKAYRPCPAFVEAGGRYRRIGQSMDEVAFGRGDSKSSTSVDTSDSLLRQTKPTSSSKSSNK
ncbi:hypothetical protein AtNW77_Chr5g0124701 [Arabidopsis thaliana]|uniref:Uncharacterized protein At5g42070 n=4 Tax=Arabidopsis TaxID=3701 RepID=Q8RWR9_ARATH|nr:uncharacterized protein AT5G42070 [Arabidopsis thaliana]KAG7604593.1 hypothetical protein ISN45_At05g036650 [Arabidopsis thaliana x Arabidopsis arenosa]KAG7611523.1 hypothetical protein ISN44_As05g036180 [Arabidopsis suecica]AAM14099.1 unknown protein [Arabidopsis thaliana]AAM45102.1 unknown protein [Arabidopsis thaliana]AAM67160.1 unknown [Arabidopsis thaliana]|eukprot:NP_568601.1 hypothetical protein AT5G42070 [Arabidopsis thaliana]